MNDQKTLANNKIYQRLTQLLHKNNFHLYRPTVTRDTIILDVVADDKHGQEGTIHFEVPRTIHSFDYLKFSDGITRDLERSLQAGWRPPRSQFERPANTVVRLEPKPKPAPADRPLLPTGPAPTEGLLQVVLLVPRAALQTVLDVTEGTATFVSATPTVAPASRLPEANTVTGFVRTMLVSFSGEFKAGEVVKRVLAERPEIARQQVNAAIVSLAKQGKLRHLRWGVYAKA